MNLNDLLTSLRLDLGDQDGVLFGDAQLERCLHRGLIQINGDLDTSYPWVANGADLTMTADLVELLLLCAKINACQMMRTRTANAFSFSSGDKRVDKTKQPEQWAELAADLTTEYKARIKQLKPDIGTTASDDYMIRPTGLSPVLYQQGVNNELDEYLGA